MRLVRRARYLVPGARHGPHSNTCVSSRPPTSSSPEVGRERRRAVAPTADQADLRPLDQPVYTRAAVDLLDALDRSAEEVN